MKGDVISASLTTRLRLGYLRHREKLWAVHPSLSRPIEEYYRELIEREGRALGLSDSSRVLFVGGGATPYTATQLAVRFGCSVVAIDRDRVAIWFARTYLANKGVRSRVCAAHGNGAAYDTRGFTVVMLALHAEPKAKILGFLASTTEPGTLIAVRNPSGAYTDLYEAMPEGDATSGLKVRNVLRHGCTFRFDTVILERQD